MLYSRDFAFCHLHPFRLLITPFSFFYEKTPVRQHPLYFTYWTDFLPFLRFYVHFSTFFIFPHIPPLFCGQLFIFSFLYPLLYIVDSFTKEKKRENFPTSNKHPNLHISLALVPSGERFKPNGR